ncbi:MAG: hypothetical protein ACXW3D_04000 [Caulobacteraceae bacterium]
MKTKLSRALAGLAGLTLILSAASAWAVTDPIPGIDVIVKKNGLAVPVTTDATGTAVLGQLPPGPCVITLTGKSLKRVYANKVFGGHYGETIMAHITVQHDGLTEASEDILLNGVGRNVQVRVNLPAGNAATAPSNHTYTATLTLLK